VFDHVTLGVSDFGASLAFYDTVVAPLGHGRDWQDQEKGGAEWGDLSIAADGRPLTTGAHVAIAARSRKEVDAFHEAAMAAGYRDNGPPGFRPQYHDGYYGAYVLDPDGNNVEAVYQSGVEWAPAARGQMIDHVAIRVVDAEAAKAFYETALAPLGLERIDEASLLGFGGDGSSLWVHEGEPTRNLHVAFAASGRATVDEFHRVAVAAGFQDNGPPGERPIYHPGYYGAYVLDPDGNNVEAVFHDRE
jgi:catechol 2,3-dioxygenase-like lactoylglutathione lyase family enzyme